ncbi:transglutaminase domain-containing protein [bacterium]|nr:transglutaminase domain-containing protein [bacterium]
MEGILTTRARRGPARFLWTGLLALLVGAGFLIYLKAAVFPFASVRPVHSEEEFNRAGDPEFDVRIPMSEENAAAFRNLLGGGYPPPGEPYGDTDVEAAGRRIARFVRGRMRQAPGVLRRVDAVLGEPVQEYPGLCSEYSKIVVAAAQSLGLTGRVIWMDGHTTSEIFFPGYGWVVVDSNGNLMFRLPADRDVQSPKLQTQEIPGRDFLQSAKGAGRWAGVTTILDSPEIPAPFRLTTGSENDPDFSDSTIRLAYRGNPLAMVVEGPRLMDFDLHTRDAKRIFRYLAFGEPIFHATQLRSADRPPAGNLRSLTLWILGLELTLLGVSIREFFRR